MDERLQERQALLEQLRNSGDPALRGRGEALEALYHARETAGLADDVYDSARETGAPPAGWVRGSERLDLVRAAMPGLDMDDEKLLDLLKPESSGFRAELYFPDPEVLGPGYRPTLAFKGSANEVRGADGELRSTAAEDFVGNNFPQSIGLKTDYYDRAMDVAVQFQRAGLEFDITGHSLGGGMASAASAVTGMRAVTHNAAGLHPETARRFSEENGGLPLYDTSQHITAWQVRGDLLNDGVQGDLAGMGWMQRQRMASLLSDAAAVVQGVPEGRAMLEQRLLSNIPETSYGSVRAFLGRLEDGDAADLIRDLPQAAGIRMPPLVAMTEVERALVRREEAASLGDLHQLGGPLLTVGAIAAKGANSGRLLGEGVAWSGRVVGDGVAGVGDLAGHALSGAGTFAEQGYRVAGTTMRYGADATGEAAAGVRLAGAGVEVAVDHAQGWAQYGGAQAGGRILRGAGALFGLVSDSARERLEAQAGQLEARGEAALARNRDEAGAAWTAGRTDAAALRGVGDAVGAGAQAVAEQAGSRHREALVYVGERLDAGLEVVGSEIAGVTARAPTAGAALGGSMGLLTGAAATYHPGNPFGGLNLNSTLRLFSQVGDGFREAKGRHGMDSAMMPSLDREIQQQEQAARDALQAGRARPGDDQAHALPASATDAGARPLLYAGETGQTLDHMLDALRRGDVGEFMRAQTGLLETPGAQRWLLGGQARLEGMDQAREGQAAGVQAEAALATEAAAAAAR